MTVVGGGELFTGNTAVVTAAVIEGKASKRALMKNWVFSYAGNFLGSANHCLASQVLLGPLLATKVFF